MHGTDKRTDRLGATASPRYYRPARPRLAARQRTTNEV